MNRGLTGPEIAEEVELPPALDQSWDCRGYYGSVSHNVKAIYQRYMGWFDGNPANLWRHPPEPAARRYVEFMGGADAVLDRAQRSFDEGDYRWVAEVVNHVVFADPTNREARELQARTFEQLGYGAENATWRNFFLMGAQELRGDEVRDRGQRELPRHGEPAHGPPGARRGGRAGRRPGGVGTELVVNVTDTDDGERYVLRLHNSVLTHLSGRHDDAATLTVALPRLALLQVVVGLADPGRPRRRRHGHGRRRCNSLRHPAVRPRDARPGLQHRHSPDRSPHVDALDRAPIRAGAGHPPRPTGAAQRPHLRAHRRAARRPRRRGRRRRQCRVVVLTGAGRGFCAGLDLRDFGTPARGRRATRGAPPAPAARRSCRASPSTSTRRRRSWWPP